MKLRVLRVSKGPIAIGALEAWITATLEEPSKRSLKANERILQYLRVNVRVSWVDSLECRKCSYLLVDGDRTALASVGVSTLSKRGVVQQS